MEIISLEEKAKQIAAEAHRGQLRKNGITPYITHPAAVVELLKGRGIKDQDILASAWLHDVIEDCNITAAFLEQELNSNIARIVGALTRDVEREEYKERIKNADYAVQIVKLADVVHNVSTLYKSLSRKTIQRRVDDCESCYIGLAEKVDPIFHEMLVRTIAPWKEYVEKLQ